MELFKDCKQKEMVLTATAFKHKIDAIDDDLQVKYEEECCRTENATHSKLI
jgi:hypothetical protein